MAIPWLCAIDPIPTIREIQTPRHLLKGIIPVQVAPLPDTQKPATIDAIVDDIGGESDIDKSAIASEISGESLILEAEGSSLNEVSQFYDENSL